MLADGRSSRLYLMLLTLCFIRSAPAETPQQLYSHVTVGTLPNGLRYAILEDHREPVASLVIRLGVGSKDEEPDEAGYAHFFEHLFLSQPPAPQPEGWQHWKLWSPPTSTPSPIRIAQSSMKRSRWRI